MGKECSFHKICLSSLFIFGNVALFIPYKNAKSGELSAILLALFVSISLYFFWYFIAGKIKEIKKGVLSKGVCIALIFIPLLANTITAKNIENYISDDVLMKNLKISIVLVFALVSVYLVVKTNTALAKLSLLSFVFVLFVMIGLIVVSYKNFEFLGAKELFLGKIFKRSFFYLYKAFWFPMVYAFYSRFAFEEKSIKNDIIGLFVGSIMIIICFLSAVFTFSLEFASTMEFSYPQSISVVNIGELYTRMDGFAYFIFFLSALIKTAICGQTVKMLLQKCEVKNIKKMTIFLLGGSFAISYIL